MGNEPGSGDTREKRQHPRTPSGPNDKQHLSLPDGARTDTISAFPRGLTRYLPNTATGQWNRGRGTPAAPPTQSLPAAPLARLNREPGCLAPQAYQSGNRLPVFPRQAGDGQGQGHILSR